MGTRLRVDGTDVDVEVVPPSDPAGRWVANVTLAQRDQWHVGVAEGADADDALAALSVTLHHYGRAPT